METSRGSAISTVGRARRIVLALTWLVVSASLLIWSMAAAAAESQAAPGTSAPSAASIGSLQKSPSPAAVPEPVLVLPGTETTSPEDEITQIVVEAPEPRYAAPTLRDRIGRVWAPVVINGRGPYRLVLDTGATHSAIIQQVVNNLGIPVAQLASVRVTGVTGSAMVPSVPVDSMQVGELFMDGTSLPVVADVFGGAQGVLGTEGLGDKRILIDFGHDRVSIMRSRGQLDRRGFETLPLRQLRDHLLALDVRVGGIRTKAIVDTGAQVSIGNNALRAALARRGLKDVSREEIEGVTLDVAYGDMMRAPPIEVGALRFNGVYITYGDMYIFDRWQLMNEPTLVLGMDVLGTVDVLVIDYRLRELQVRLRKS
jgi:predicted aspartyl protease